jgi:excisionase family DNA binding protein
MYIHLPRIKNNIFCKTLKMEKQILIDKATLSDLRTMISDTMEQYLRPATIETKAPTPILTRQQAAKMLNVSLPTLHYWTKEGMVKGTRIGSCVRYRMADIEAALVDIDSLKYKRRS